MKPLSQTRMPLADSPTMTVHGTVVHGDRLGRELGFPTANVQVVDDFDLPPDGVYAAWFVRADGSVRPGAASLGMRPTVAPDGCRILEVHVLDVDGWIELYDECVTVRFVERVRGQMRFDGLASLVAQIGRDCNRVRRLLRDSGSELSGDMHADPLPAAAADPDGDSTDHEETVSLTRMSIATLGVTAVLFFSSTPVTIALPEIGRDLGDVRWLSWVLGAYVLGSALGLLVGGPAIDAFGVRKTFRVCVVWFVVATGFCAVAPSLPLLVGLRGLQGVGSGFAQSAAFSAIAIAYPARLRPRMFAANSVLWGVAGLAAPTIGSLVVTTMGWRWLFVLNIPVALLAASFGWRVLPARQMDAPAFRVDGRGIAMLGLGTAVLLAAFNTIGITTAPLLLVVALLAAGYWRHSGRDRDPVLPRKLLAGRPNRWLNLTGLLAFTVPWGLSSYAAVVVIAGLGREQAVAAIIVTSHSVGWICGSLASGMVWRGRDPVVLLTVGCTLMTVGAAVGAVAWQPHTPVVVLAAVAACLALGGGISNNLSLSQTQAIAAPGEVARALSAFQFVRNFGSAMGSAVTGSIILTVVAVRAGGVDRLRDALGVSESAPAGAEVGKAVLIGSRLAHIVAAGLAFVALMAAVRMRRWTTRARAAIASASAPCPIESAIDQ